MKLNLKKFAIKISKVEKIDNQTEKFWPVFVVSLALFLIISFGQFIDFVKAASGTSGVSFTATVGTSLTFTVDNASKSLGSVISGTPVYATSTLTINTNNNLGAFTTLTRASSTATLCIPASNCTISTNVINDTPNGNNWSGPGGAATSTAGPSAAWTNGTTNGLGFRVASGASLTTCGAVTTWWGTLDDGSTNTKYSGVSTTTASTAQSTIANCGYYVNGNTTQTVVYKLDVSAAQAAASYISSPITYTVTTN